ncbi:MAG TPA: TRAP transporter small permease [Dictyoglomaceae bacterium]|nr:TRAP transporter small permease [Dictyoglomaceae bacterium]
MRKIYEYSGKIETFVVQALLVAMTILVFIAGVSRTIHRPIGWANPLASFLFAWSVFMATDAAFRENKIMSVNILVNKLPERMKSYTKLFNYFVILAFCIFLIVFGIKVSYIMRFRTFEGMYGFSYMWAGLSVPVGGFLILVTTIFKISDEIKTLRGGNKSQNKG